MVLQYKKNTGTETVENGAKESEQERMGERGEGRWKGGEKEGVRDWVSSDCVSGQLHMFLIKVLTLWDQLHTGMLVFVIRPNLLWSGGSPKNTASSGPSPQLAVLKPGEKITAANSHACTATCPHNTP